jgi:hypothetical protein
VKFAPNLIASPLFFIKLLSSYFSSLFLDMKLVFTAGVPFHSGELSEPSPSLVNCRLGENDVPGLNAAYCQASYYPLGDLSGDCFAFFLLELLVDLGVDNPVVLVLHLISPDVHMPYLPAKPLCFLLLLLCIEFSKRNLLLCGEIFGGVWKS